MGQNLLLLGGIGDFLQSIPYIEANRENNNKYYVVSHLSGAANFFESIGVVPEFLEIFSTNEEQKNVLQKISDVQITHCPRYQYFDKFPFNSEPNFFKNNKPVVGIHINGSKFSITQQKKIGTIIKSIPARVIKELISDRHNLMIFGLKQDLQFIGLHCSDNLAIITCDNPAKSLAYVNQCNAFVGSDSGFKTMSAMNKIPTFVWLGDYIDEARDSMFIDPYVKDGVMEIFRYKDANRQFDRGIENTKNFLERII